MPELILYGNRYKSEKLLTLMEDGREPYASQRTIGYIAVLAVAVGIVAYSCTRCADYLVERFLESDDSRIESVESSSEGIEGYLEK